MAKHLKIQHPDRDTMLETFKQIMNIANVVASAGELPTDEDRRGESARQIYWRYQDGANWDTVDLCPLSNNWKAFIREKGDNHTTIEFTYRYDRTADTQADALANLILARFSETVTDVTPTR